MDAAALPGFSTDVKWSFTGSETLFNTQEGTRQPVTGEELLPLFSLCYLYSKMGTSPELSYTATEPVLVILESSKDSTLSLIIS